MFHWNMPTQRGLACRLAHPVAEFAPDLISILIFSGCVNEKELTSINFPAAKLWSVRLAFAEENLTHDPISNRKIDDTRRSRSGAGLFAVRVSVPVRRSHGAGYRVRLSRHAVECRQPGGRHC